MDKKKLKIMILIVSASMIFNVSNVYAKTIWSDDFDDKNIDDWETELLDWDLDNAFTGETCEFDLSEGTLKAPGDTPGNIWYLANHESTVEYGKWSFDVNIVDTPWTHFYVFLMTDNWEDYPIKSHSYDIIFITEEGELEPDSVGGIVLYKRWGYSAMNIELGTWSSTENILGWRHLEVTRDPDGVFDVYFDEEHIIHVEDTDPQSGMFTTFRFEAPSGPEIDNIVVSDLSPEPEPEPEPEDTSSGIPGFPVLSLALGLVAISLIIYHRKK